MSVKDTMFYRGRQEYLLEFSAEEVSTDGAAILLEKIEREFGLLEYIDRFIPDNRCSVKTVHSTYKMLKQRVFLLIHGYEDCNDVLHLKNDPILQDVLQGELVSQPTLSRFENSITKRDIFNLSYAWLDRYVDSLEGRQRVVIDIDCTDDPAHGQQQRALFNGFYGQFMYNELFFHDGDTGQIIVPVLRPGNSHSNRWYASILERIIKAIKDRYPDMEIFIRADSGFSGPKLYDLADKYGFKFAVGQATNNVLKKEVSVVKEQVKTNFLDKGEKHQHFMSFKYKAKSWNHEQQCVSKIESTGKGMNIRHIISNIDDKTPEEIYFDFYVQRGETSENRIKEVKNMCFSDRLSNHGYWANFFRLLLSSLAYEMFVLIKKEIQKTKYEVAKKWQISSIRTYLLKVGATIRRTKRRIYYKLSKSFVYQDLFRTLITK